jgi:hypothetical protein
MLSAAITAMFSDYESASNVTSKCPGSRCTWEPYTTLALCYSVEDVTSTLVEHKQELVGPAVFSPAALDQFRPPPNGRNRWYNTFWTEAVYYSNHDVPWSYNLSHIADAFVVAFDPCKNPDLNTGNSTGQWHNVSVWTAYRGTIGLCLQTLNSSFKGATTNTTVIQTRQAVDLRWDKDADNYCTSIDGDPARYCVDDKAMHSLGATIENVFSGSASLFNGGSNEFTTDWIFTLAQDILGPSPNLCNEGPRFGINGFSRRLNNIATSMTNS